ncbi:MAG: hypothetical protein IK108_07955 [Clostridia bacterium]|nr:hypothetical protein [Clostridia bacterium]
MTKKKGFIIFGVVLFILSAMAIGFLLLRHSRSERSTATFVPSEKKVIEFGSYPQSRIANEALISELNRQDSEWKSYGYYNGRGAVGTARQSDYMQYTDICYNGEKYRGVRFSEYRSYCCHKSSESSWQQRYYHLDLDTVYWYKYEPIRWIVLNEDGSCFLMSENVLDSQPFNSVIYTDDPSQDLVLQAYYKDAAHTVYGLDYYESDIRAWLNGNFFETAFSAEEAEQILITELDNSAWNKCFSEYDSQNSFDKVFLLSYDESTNPSYGFSKQAEKTDNLRTAFPTDYALCQGVWTVGGLYKTGACWWWLRTAGTLPSIPCAPTFYGSIVFTLNNPYTPDCVDTGVRPAIRLSELPN